MAKEEELRPYEGGGAGGKLRTSRSARRSSTPYDRPQTGRHASAAVRAAAAAADNRRSGSTWFSRIVDPASRLITQSAVQWFSSVFKKNTPALPSAAAEVEEIQEDSLQEVPEEAVENAKVIAQDREATPTNKQRSEPEFTEVEQLLKNKTFSREEFNRLTELLQSRVVDRTSGLKDRKEHSREELHGGVEPSNVVNAEAQRWREERQKAREEKEDSVRQNRLFANAPTLALPRNLPDEAGSSPADIAKAFMGVRPYRASSLALQSRPFRDENTPIKPNGLSLVPRTESWLVGNGQVEDKFKTPQTARMRSRIQNLGRTPYARNVHQQAPVERLGKGFPISTPVSQWTPIQSPITGGRQTLKRRSSVLDDDFTSGGPIRRTRHKPIFGSQLRNPDPSGSTSNQIIPFLSPRNVGERNMLESVRKPTEFEKQNAFHSREATTKQLYLGPCIPPQSSETARKILEHLDRMVPSPKEISAEAQLAIARDKSPSQLTVSMLNGPARRSTESIDATSLFDKYSPSSVQKNNEQTGQGASTAEQKYGGKGKAPLFNSVTTAVEEPTFSGIGDASSLIPNAIPARYDAKSLILDGPFDLPEKSKGFRMSALEESDDEGHATRNAGMSRHAQTGRARSFTSDSIAATNSITLDGDKQITSTTVSRTRPEANLVTSATSVSIDSSSNNSSGFTFPVTPSNSNFAEPPPTPTVVPSPSNKISTQPLTASSTPTYNFGPVSPSKGPIFSFSTSGSTDVDTTKPKFDFKFESKPESSFSSTAVAAAASASTYGSESSALIFKSSSASGLSGSSPTFSSSGSMFSTSTAAAATSVGFPLFGGSISETNGMNSVPFSFSGKSSAASAIAKTDSKLRSPETIPQVGPSSVISEDHSFKSSTSGANCTVKSQNELKTSGVSPSPSLLGVTDGTSSTLSSTAAISASTSSLFPNTQSAFAGSLFGQASSSATVTTSAPFAFGSSANMPSLSSSLPSASLFSSSTLCGNTSPSLFGSTLSASASSASGSLFGLTAPSSSGSFSVPSFGLSNSSTSQFASTSTPASGSGTTTTFGAASSPSVGSIGTSSFSSSSSTSFGLGSSSQFGSNTSPSFGLSTTPQFGSSTSPSFGLSTTPQFNSSTSPSFGITSIPQSSSSTAPSFGSGVTFGSNTTSSFATGSTPSFGSGSTPAFASGSISPFVSGSTPSFVSGSTFGSSSSPSFGASSSLFGSASAPSFGGSSVSFGTANTPAFGGSSASYVSASTSFYGSSSTPSFGVGQSFGASSATSSQSTLPSFGSGFGGTASLPSAGFSFGGSTAAGSSSFTFGGAGNTPSGSTFSFESAGTTPSTFTFASKDSSSMPQPPIFGLTNSNSAFGATPSPTPQADQMEDSMSEDPAQVSSPAPPVFGGQSASLAPSFVFGSQPTAPSPGQSVFQFGAQPGPAAPNPFAPTPAGGGLEFSGGGFSLGAGGEKSGRKFIKAKRDKARRK